MRMRATAVCAAKKQQTQQITSRLAEPAVYAATAAASSSSRQQQPHAKRTPLVSRTPNTTRTPFKKNPPNPKKHADFAQHYVKGKVIGSGSFGVVHLGIDLHTGQEVAVKVMPKQRGKLTRERTLQKLVKEVGILASLQVRVRLGVWCCLFVCRFACCWLWLLFV
jgi:hypothetical protein